MSLPELFLQRPRPPPLNPMRLAVIAGSTLFVPASREFLSPSRFFN